jgi:hypothetical protein
MKQTAVQFLLENIVITSSKNLVSVIEKAIEMEKEQQDDFAIGFAEWCKQEYELEDTSLHNKWRDVNGEYRESKELLEIYKKEKGL